jgi:hypothetical protein
VDKLSEGSFSLDEAVWDIHLSAEVGEPDNKFDGIDVVSNHNKLGLLFLNKFGDMVKTELNVVRLGVFNLFLFIMQQVLSALNLASATNRALRCLASSGEYFFRSLKRTPAE